MNEIDEERIRRILDKFSLEEILELMELDHMEVLWSLHQQGDLDIYDEDLD